MRKSKKCLAGLLALCFLLVPGLPIFSAPGDVVLTAEEYAAIQKALTTAANELQKAKSEIKQLQMIIDRQNITLIEQDKILTMQSTVWSMLKISLTEQENDLKSEYRRGFWTGLFAGVAAGFLAGETIGISIGVRIPVS